MPGSVCSLAASDINSAKGTSHTYGARTGTSVTSDSTNTGRINAMIRTSQDEHCGGGRREGAQEKALRTTIR